jgi:DNA-binding NtrC family response regulator
MDMHRGVVLKRGKKPQYRVLSVGKEPDTLSFIRMVLSGISCDVYDCCSVEKAVGLLEFSDVNMVFVEMDMPMVSGAELLRYIKENFPDTEVMIYGPQQVETAVRAIKEGAEDYLACPFDAQQLTAVVQKMIGKIELRNSVQGDVPGQVSHGIIGGCEPIKAVFRMIDKAAASMVNVLIFGESGTGKELVARAIHYKSECSRAPFVSVNCTAIPDGLLESELFWHVKGNRPCR